MKIIPAWRKVFREYIADFEATRKPSTKLKIRVYTYGDYIKPVEIHRLPWWMKLSTHRAIEHILDLYPGPRQGIMGWHWHIIHGLVCDYPMKEIVKFLKGIRDVKKHHYKKMKLNGRWI